MAIPPGDVQKKVYTPAKDILTEFVSLHHFFPFLFIIPRKRKNLNGRKEGRKEERPPEVWQRKEK